MAWSDDDLKDEEFPEDADDDEESDFDQVRCPRCRAWVYEDADQCPSCGEWIVPSLKDSDGKRWVWWVRRS